jgi:ketosteroid isomerase-like protein
VSDHKHAAKYREVLSEFNSGNTEAFAAVISDDVVWWMIGADEPIRGKAALEQTMQENMGSWNIQATLHDVLSNDTHLVALVEAVATHEDGTTLSYRTAEIHHVDENGKVTERWAFSDDTEAIKSFFG